MIVKPLPFKIRNHYWIVAESATQVFSSKAKAYVPVSNATYLAWLAKGYRPTKIATEAELLAVLAEQAPECLPSTTAGDNARKENLIGKLEIEKVGRVLATALFYHENRIRKLEKKPEITKQQFIAALKDLL